MTRWLFALIVLLASARTADAQIVCDVTTADASRTAVNNAIQNAGANGHDTICVPTGTATWSTPIILPNIDLTVAGNSVITCTGGSSSADPTDCTATNNTNITCSTGACFTLPFTATHRITQFSMTCGGSGGNGCFDYIYTSDVNVNDHFRVDHNRLASNNGWAEWQIVGGDNCVHPQGVIDNNLMVDISIQPQGTDPGDDISEGFGSCQQDIWTTNVATLLGAQNGVVVAERNEWANTGSNVNSMDCNHGTRYVARFNSITSGVHTYEIHGVQGENRGCMTTEIYENNASGLTGFSGTVFWRGGTGMVFNNRQSAAFSFGVLLTNDRSELDDPIATFGQCDGSHAGVDGNTGTRGYPCRDQPGRGHDTVEWTCCPGAGAYTQTAAPIYVWGNLTGGAAMDVEVDSTGDADVHIVVNRDYYNISTGTSLPGTCTVGQGFWKTDEGGNWNTLNAGSNDGRLYKCTTTNNWTVYYTPLTYPHPWAGGEAPPQGPITRRVFAGGTSAPGDDTYTNAQLQEALNDANPGDTILTQEEFDYIASNGFVLPARKACPAQDATCTISWRTGVTSTGAPMPGNTFPGPNTRQFPRWSSDTTPVEFTFAVAQHNKMSSLQPTTNNQAAIRTVLPGETGTGLCTTADCVAEWWDIQSIHFKGDAEGGGAAVVIGDTGITGNPNGNNQDTVAKAPNHITFDRVYISGDRNRGQVRCIQSMGRNVTIKNSSTEYCKGMQADGQSIYVLNSPGPTLLLNNHFRSGTEGFMTEGANPAIRLASSCLASPAPTVNGCRLNAVHPDMRINDWVGLTINGTEITGNEYAVKVTGINAGTGDVTWTTEGVPLPSAPLASTANIFQWNLTVRDITIQKNNWDKPAEERNFLYPTAPTITSVTPVSAGGTLTVGNTYCYRVAARGYLAPFVPTVTAGTARSVTGAEVCAVLTAGNNAMQITWGAVQGACDNGVCINADAYHVYGRVTGAQDRYFQTIAPTVTVTDTGQAGTTPGPSNTALNVTEGSRWINKNNIETKGLDVGLIECNAFRRSFEQAQTGPLILFKANGHSAAPGTNSSVFRNVILRKNWGHSATSAINIQREGNPTCALVGGQPTGFCMATGPIENFTIENNLFEDISEAYVDNTATSSFHTIFINTETDPFILHGHAPRNLSIIRNTFVKTVAERAFIGMSYNKQGTQYTGNGMIVRDNLTRREANGVNCLSSSGAPAFEGTAAMNTCTTGTTALTHNVIAGASLPTYPATNHAPSQADFEDAFVDYAGGNYRLDPTDDLGAVWLTAGSTGGPIGANMDEIFPNCVNVALSGDNTGLQASPGAAQRVRIRLRR